MSAHPLAMRGVESLCVEICDILSGGPYKSYCRWYAADKKQKPLRDPYYILFVAKDGQWGMTATVFTGVPWKPQRALQMAAIIKATIGRKQENQQNQQRRTA